MNALRFITAAAACLGALTFTTPASASMTWDWTFNSGSEQGTFTTNGTEADAVGSFNFTISDVSVTASSLAPSLVGASFTVNQPTQGFLWNGSAPTQFYRNNGSFTNGANFLNAASSLRLTFGMSGSNMIGLIVDPNDFSPFFQLSAGTLAPAATAVPEPASWALMALGAAAVGATRRRRVAA